MPLEFSSRDFDTRSDRSAMRSRRARNPEESFNRDSSHFRHTRYASSRAGKRATRDLLPSSVAGGSRFLGFTGVSYRGADGAPRFTTNNHAPSVAHFELSLRSTLSPDLYRWFHGLTCTSFLLAKSLTNSEASFPSAKVRLHFLAVVFAFYITLFYSF